MIRRIFIVIAVALSVAAILVMWPDKGEAIGGGWYADQRAALHMDDRCAKGTLHRFVAGKRIEVGRDVYEYRFYTPDCVLWLTGRTLFGGCGDRRPFPVAISGSLDWELLDDGAHYLGVFRVDGGRQPPKTPQLIHVDSVRAVAERQPPLDSTYVAERIGEREFDAALTPVAEATPIDVSWVSGKKETQLHLAVAQRDRARMDALLAAGAKLNAGDYLNATPLFYAVRGPQPVDSVIVQRLLDAGAYINSRNDHGFTPLMMAAQDAPIGVVQLMLDRGADPRLEDKDGARAEHHADRTRPNREALVKLLRHAR